MTVEEIKIILAGTEQILRLLTQQPMFRLAEKQLRTEISIEDAIQLLHDLYEEIEESPIATQPANLFDLLGTKPEI
ncbi:hypothetical protein [Microcoleus sp. D3_18a_C4]|uniref:hypothetical protein n=1 Tax=Microcoleus sp. D3_18a_C4 TaxID=3055332 RepID=UPI002FD4B014